MVSPSSAQPYPLTWPTPGAAVITVDGHVDLRSTGRLRAAVDTAISEDADVVVLDLSGVSFMDSSGLGAVVGAMKACRQVERDLRVAGVSGRVADLMRLTQLDRVLELHGTVGDALDA